MKQRHSHIKTTDIYTNSYDPEHYKKTDKNNNNNNKTRERQTVLCVEIHWHRCYCRHCCVICFSFCFFLSRGMLDIFDFSHLNVNMFRRRLSLSHFYLPAFHCYNENKNIRKKKKRWKLPFIPKNRVYAYTAVSVFILCWFFSYFFLFLGGK